MQSLLLNPTMNIRHIIPITNEYLNYGIHLPYLKQQRITDESQVQLNNLNFLIKKI